MYPQTIDTYLGGAYDSSMLKSKLLKAIQDEIQHHDFSTFVQDGIVRSGCPGCKKPLNSIGQFVDHLCNDAMPKLIERLSAVQPNRL